MLSSDLNLIMEINKIILNLENLSKINSTDFETIAKFDYLIKQK